MLEKATLKVGKAQWMSVNPETALVMHVTEPLLSTRVKEHEKMSMPTLPALPDLSPSHPMRAIQSTPQT
jgi:hypothetical protein